MTKENIVNINEMLEMFKKLLPKSQKHIFELLLMANVAEQSAKDNINQKGA